jgi:hypothetical protein
MKGLKTGGRKKGIPNKVSAVVSEILAARNTNLVDEAMELYTGGNREFKLKVLSLLFPYVYPKLTESLPQPDETIDITPENEEQVMLETIEYIKQKHPKLLE